MLFLLDTLRLHCCGSDSLCEGSWEREKGNLLIADNRLLTSGTHSLITLSVVWPLGAPPLPDLIHVEPRRCSWHPLHSAPASGPRPWSSHRACISLSSYLLDQLIPAHGFTHSLHTDKTLSPTSGFHPSFLLQNHLVSCLACTSRYFHCFVRKKKQKDLQIRDMSLWVTLPSQEHQLPCVSRAHGIALWPGSPPRPRPPLTLHSWFLSSSLFS